MWLGLCGVRIVWFPIINGPDAQNLMGFLHLLIFIAVMEKGERKMKENEKQNCKHIKRIHEEKWHFFKFCNT